MYGFETWYLGLSEYDGYSGFENSYAEGNILKSFRESNRELEEVA